jgi:hypothetical protein
VARDRVAAQVRSYRAEIDRLEREMASERAFQDRFRVAIIDERQARARALKRLSALEPDGVRTRHEITDANRAFAGMSSERAGALHAQGLIDREQFLTMSHQLAQIAQANLALADKEADLLTRGDQLSREVGGLEHLAGTAPDRPIPADLLTLDVQYLRSSLLVLADERARADAMQAVQELVADLARYDRLLESIRGEPYLKATQSRLTVAFAPYSNLPRAREGQPVFACAWVFVWCHEVGSVKSIIPGEILMPHPARHEQLRGVMLELALTEGDAAKEQLLQLSHPLGI